MVMDNKVLYPVDFCDGKQNQKIDLNIFLSTVRQVLMSVEKLAEEGSGTIRNSTV